MNQGYSTGNGRAGASDAGGAHADTGERDRANGQAAGSSHSVRIGRPRPVIDAARGRNAPRVAPPSSARKLIRNLSGDSSRPQLSSLREVLFLLAFIVVCLSFYWGWKYVTRPPDISRMSAGNLARHVAKARGMLERDAGVLVGVESEDTLELRIYPFDGGEPFVFDRSAGFSDRIVSPPYEPAFTYWRLSHRIAPPLVVLDDFFSALTDGGMISLINYSPPKRSTSDRFIFDLFDFKVERETDMGIDTAPREGVNQSNVIPSPSGDTYYVLSAPTPFPPEYRFRVLSGVRSDSPVLTDCYVLRSDWAGDRPGAVNVRYFLSEPQPCEDGFIAFAYTIETNTQTGVESIIYESAIRIVVSGNPDDALRKIERVDDGNFIDEMTPRPKTYCRIEELVRMEPGRNGVPVDALDRFVSFYYDEKNGKIVGYQMYGGARGNFATTLATYDETDGFTPIAEFDLATQMFLVDYYDGYMFLMTGDEPGKPGTFEAERKLRESGIEGGEENKPATRRGQTSYFLNRIDLSTMEVIPIRELAAAKRTTVGGSNFLSVPILTVSVQKKRVVTTDGNDLVLLDYDGNLVKTLESDDKLSYGMLYAMNGLAGTDR